MTMFKNTPCNRRQLRRQSERRSNPFSFNTEGWIAFMQQHYQMWPKQDRRRHDRRTEDRRNQHDRVPPNSSKPLPIATQLFATRDLLSNAEKQMILQLFAEEI